MVHACTRKFVEAFVPKKYKKTVDINPIPPREDIKVIKYNVKGEAKYDVSSTYAFGCGERYMLINKMDEDVFLNYILDGKYQSYSLDSKMDLSQILEYDIAREKRMDTYCETILTSLCEKLTVEASLEKGRAYSLNK